jgi:hypothetical protein
MSHESNERYCYVIVEGLYRCTHAYSMYASIVAPSHRPSRRYVHHMGALLQTLRLRASFSVSTQHIYSLYRVRAYIFASIALPIT